MVVEPGILRAALVVLLAPAGNRNDLNIAKCGHRTDPSRHLITIHVRHSNVEQNGVGEKLIERMECFAPAVSDAHGRAEGAQQIPEPLTGIVVVVDHENAERRKRLERTGWRRKLHLSPDQRQLDDEFAALAEAAASRL